jgi:hypothetical protein
MNVHADQGSARVQCSAVRNHCHRASRRGRQLTSLPGARELACPTVLSVLLAGPLAVPSR